MKRIMKFVPLVWLSLSVALLLAGAASSIQPKLATEPVSKDPDDPAIWVHPNDPARSFILGTNKTPAPTGALVVFGLDGRIRQTIDGIDRPNNVDVEDGLKLSGKPTDIAVLTERLQKRLRAFAIAHDGSGLKDLGAQGLPVFADQSGEKAAPMGVALYRRPKGWRYLRHRGLEKWAAERRLSLAVSTSGRW